MSRQTENFNRYKNRKKLILAGERKMPTVILRKIFRPLLRIGLGVQRKINGLSVEMLNEVKFPENRPVIFALTHIGKWDFEIVNEQIKESSL